MIQLSETANMRTRTLENFVRRFCIYSQDDDKPHTHTFFGEEKVKKLSIPETDMVDFRKAYFTYCNHTEQDILCTKGFNSITEKATNKFRFFVDLDFKIDHFKEGIVKHEDVPALMKKIVTIFSDVIQNAFGEPVAFETAFRMFYKCHIHYPSLIVTPAQAKSICADVGIRLKEEYPWMKNPKWDILDTSVYRSGLRMLYSHKGKMHKSEHVEQHVAYFGESLPYEHYYRLGFLNDDGTIQYDKFTLESLEKTSIICNADDSEKEFVSEYRQIAPASKLLKGKTSCSSSSSSSKTTMNRGHTESGTEDAMSDVEISPDVIFLIREYLDEVLSNNMGLDSTIQSIKVNEHGSYLVVLAPQTCPIKSMPHKRTTEHNQSATYVVLNAFDCSLRCFDEACTDIVVLKRPNEELYKRLKGSTKDFVLKKSLYKQTHESIANQIFDLLKHSYSASPAAGNNYIWYYYDKSEHRWVIQENIMLEIMSDSGIIQTAYHDFINRITNDNTLTENDRKTMKDLWCKLERDLQMTGFVRSGLMPLLARKLEKYWMGIIKRQCNNIIRGTTFQSVLDDNPTLMGFKNGVWDFRKMIFREGQPTDFISMSTNLAYIPYEQIPNNTKEDMFAFLRKIYPKKEHFEYVMFEIASCLNGTADQQRMFLMSGRGANGKSTLIRMLKLSLGDYAGEVAITVFTKPQPPSNAPNPALIAIKGQRFVDCSEPNARDPLHLGTIKWLTGGDRITAAQKYERNQSFYLQCTFFLLTNDIPPIHASIGDYGTWRRLKPVEHYSRFVPHPDPNNPNEFQSDDQVNYRMMAWREAFISYLIHIYTSKKFVPVPKEFSEALSKLQDNSDVYARFIHEYVVVDSDEFKEAMAVFAAFTDWNKMMKMVKKEVPFDHFKKHMLTLLGDFVEDEEGHKGWNISLRTMPSTYW